MATSILAAALGLHGRKPEVPAAPRVDPQAAQEAAISGNIAALPNLEQLASVWNQFSVENMQKTLETALPGYRNLVNTGTQQIQSFLRGQIPDDVFQQVQRLSAERATAGGYGGSPAAGALTARDLGLTSLSLIQGGLQAADRWIAQARARTPTYDFSQMFITPQQQVSYQQWNEANRFQAQWLRNKISAMPSPTQAAIGGLLDWMATTGESIGSMYAGNLGGMMGGGQQSAVPDYNLSAPTFARMSGMQGEEMGQERLGFGSVY